MSTVVWEVIDRLSCDRTGEMAQLLEQRAYAPDHMPDGGGRAFQVLSRKCSLGDQCNMVEYTCRWSFINPDFDPFPHSPAQK
jgi:hypothetical protein